VTRDMKSHILLKHINLLDVENGVLINDTDILIKDDIIKEIGRAKCRNEESLMQFNCAGKFALPGLFDCHTHLNVLTNQGNEVKKEILKEGGIEENIQEHLEKQTLKDFAVKGITQLRDLGGPFNILKDLKDKISRGEYTGPEIFYAGPRLEKNPLTAEANNSRWPGWTIAVDTRQDAENVIQEISGQNGSLVKTFGRFDTDILKYLLDQATKHSLPLTHDSGSTFFHSVPIGTGIDLGIKCFEHGKNLWYVALKDELKSEHDGLVNAQVEVKQSFIEKVMSLGTDSISLAKLWTLINKMLENDVYLCPTLHVMKFFAEKPEVISEDEPEKYKKIFEKLYQVGYELTKEIIKGKIKILVGQDGYIPRFTFNEMELLKEVGLPEWEIIKGASIYPAKWLGVADKFGSISPNKKANVLILDKSPLEHIRNIRTTYLVLKDGKVVFQG